MESISFEGGFEVDRVWTVGTSSNSRRAGQQMAVGFDVSPEGEGCGAKLRPWLGWRRGCARCEERGWRVEGTTVRAFGHPGPSIPLAQDSVVLVVWWESAVFAQRGKNACVPVSAR